MGKPKKEKDVRFSKFGTVSFTGTTRVNDWIDFLEDGKVMGSKCTDCGELYFPPRADCYKCLDSNMEWFEVTGKGKLLAVSQLMYAPIGFGDDLPYAIAVVDFGDYKVFGRIGDVPLDQVEIGMELTVAPNKLPNGNINYVFNQA